MVQRAKTTGRPMVVVGAGQGGIQAAESLREEGWEGEIILFGDEPHPPYHRPPLSKDMLLETLDFDLIMLRGPAEIAAKGIDFRPGVHVLSIDRAAREVSLDSGAPGLRRPRDRHRRVQSPVADTWRRPSGHFFAAQRRRRL